MKSAEIAKLSQEELVEKLEEMTKEYSSLKLTHTVTPLENPMQIRTLRRNIARVKTALNNI